MKSPYVKRARNQPDDHRQFSGHSKEIRQKKTGELYLSLLIGDRTGEVEAKMWDNVADASARLTATISSRSKG